MSDFMKEDLPELLVPTNMFMSDKEIVVVSWNFLKFFTPNLVIIAIC